MQERQTITQSAGAQYTLDNDWLRARQRLSALERIHDPATIEYLEEIGVAEGWRCLEVGGGGGSIAEWLCRQVGPAGRVVATDINTRFLARLNRANFTILEHDITTDELPVKAFDLVHARTVLMHIPDWEPVLRKSAAAVRPGGWILVEEPDFVTYGPDPALDAAAAAIYDRVFVARRSVASRAMDLTVGARLFRELDALGFEDVQAEGRARTIKGGSPEAGFEALTAEQHRDIVVGTGLVTSQEYDHYVALWDNPAFVFRQFLVTSVRGRKPRS